jgi:hypothetical protein
MVQMLGVFAEFERAAITERVIAGMERKAARGSGPAGRFRSATGSMRSAATWSPRRVRHRWSWRSSSATRAALREAPRSRPGLALDQRLVRRRIVDRYFRAFEDGNMPEAACAPRLERLTQRTEELHARHEELAIHADEEPEPLNDEDRGRSTRRSVRSSRAATRRSERRSCRRWSKRSASRAGRRSTRSSLYPRFDHRALSAPAWIRTRDLRIRSPLLYPAELRGRAGTPVPDRGDRIRTGDLGHPKAARYQAAPRPGTG